MLLHIGDFGDIVLNVGIPAATAFHSVTPGHRGFMLALEESVGPLRPSLSVTA